MKEFRILYCDGTLEEVIKIQKLNDKKGNDKWLGWLHRGGVIDACKKEDCLYIKDKDQVIGFLIGNSKKNGDGKVYSICVDQDYRQQGIGKVLLKEFLTKNKRLVFKVMKTNESGMKFFTKLGSQIIKEGTNKRGTELLEFELIEIK